MSEKITSRHLQRRALVYVRQSSYQQLLHNVESRRLQYAMEKRVRDLGWNETEVIDEDQGRSATTTIGRTGFQRLVAEVCLGKVGAVAAIESPDSRATTATGCVSPLSDRAIEPTTGACEFVRGRSRWRPSVATNDR